MSATDLDLLAEPGRGRRGQALDEDLVGAAEARSGASRPGSRGPPPAPPPSGRSRSCRCRPRAGRSASGRRPGTAPPARRSAAPMSVAAADRRRGDPVDLREVGRQPLDERVAAEGDDPGDVARPPSPRGVSRRNASASSRPGRRRPSRTGPRRTPSPGGPPAARAGSPASANTSAESSSDADRERRPPPPDAQPPPGRQRGARSTTPMSGGSSSSASGASKRDAHQAPLPAGRAPRSRAASAAPQPRERVALVDEPLERQDEQGDQHDRDPELVARVGPRLGGRPPAPAPGPGLAAAWPSAWSRGGVARARSVTRRRRGGPPRSAPGRPGRRDGTSATRRPTPGRPTATADGDAPALDDGAGVASGSAMRGHAVDAEQVGAGEGHGSRAAGAEPRARPCVPSGRVDPHADRAGRDRQGDGRAGRDRLERRLGAAQQLAGEVREQDRERDLERQVRAARLEGQHRRRAAGAASRRRGAARRRGPGSPAAPRPAAPACCASATWTVVRST